MNLLGFDGATLQDILPFLDLADEFVDATGKLITPRKYRDALAHHSIGLLFFEPSTRTRASFELAVDRLGGYPLQLASESSSIKKGETELDTCQNLQAMGMSGFVIRHSDRDILPMLGKSLRVPVINAGNGAGEHPTQALLDAFTLRRALRRERDLEGVTVLIMGDIAHSRVARSDVAVLRALGASVRIAGPESLLPPDGLLDATSFTDRKAALEGVDAVIVLRIQRERMPADVIDEEAFIARWAIDEEVVRDELPENAFIMHPGPVMRGVELTSDVADSDRSLILQQATNGVAIRQAVLLKCLKKEI